MQAYKSFLSHEKTKHFIPKYGQNVRFKSS